MLLSFPSSAWSFMTVGNAILLVLFLFLLNLLIELYDFRGMPPGPRFYSLPVIGNIFSMGTTGGSLRENTQRLRQTYGRLFSVKLGGWKAVIASSPESVKEVLTKKSGDFAGRPPFWSPLLTTKGGKDLIMGTYGPVWRLHRKLFVTALRQYLKDVSLVESNITHEAQGILQFLKSQNEMPFDPKDILMTSTANVISTVTFGADYNVNHPKITELLLVLDRIIKDREMNTTNMMLDLFPLARYFPFKSYKKALELTEMKYSVIQSLLTEQEKLYDATKTVISLTTGLLHCRKEMEITNATEKKDLMDNICIMNTVIAMFAAGYDTAVNSFLWAIAFLINYPKYQIQLQEHLDQVVGRNRLPCLDDRPNLPLVHAIIREIQRLGNVVDATLPHYTLNDTTLCGYRVPKDTIVFADLESLHLDPECWENPEEFNPFRHIDSEGQLITDQGNWLPFSAGRRGCPGESLAKVELFLFLSIMVQRFTFVPEDDHPPPDLKGVRCFTKYPRPYKVKAIKRF